MIDFFHWFQKQNSHVQLFLIIEGVAILGWFANGAWTLINNHKLFSLLRDKYPIRLAENHVQGDMGRITSEGRAYIWSELDDEIPELYEMKIKIRVGKILNFEPLVVTVLNVIILVCVK